MNSKWVLILIIVACVYFFFLIHYYSFSGFQFWRWGWTGGGSFLVWVVGIWRLWATSGGCFGNGYFQLGWISGWVFISMVLGCQWWVFLVGLDQWLSISFDGYGLLVVGVLVAGIFGWVEFVVVYKFRWLWSFVGWWWWCSSAGVVAVVARMGFWL